jgi:hypothetical protein
MPDSAWPPPIHPAGAHTQISRQQPSFAIGHKTVLHCTSIPTGHHLSLACIALLDLALGGAGGIRYAKKLSIQKTLPHVQFFRGPCNLSLIGPMKIQTVYNFNRQTFWRNPCCKCPNVNLRRRGFYRHVTFHQLTGLRRNFPPYMTYNVSLLRRLR